MRPVLLELGSWDLNSYGTLILLGTLASMPGSFWDARDRGLGAGRGGPLSFFLDLYLVLFFGTLVGGRLLFVLTSPSILLDDPARIFALDAAGFVFFGSFFGIVIGLFFLAKKYDAEFGEVMDLFTTWLPIAHLGGRLGCFMAGCCYGAPTTAGTGVAFPATAIAFHDPNIPNTATHTVPLHPTQLYEAAGLVVLAIALAAFRRVRGTTPPWRQASRYALGYGVLRLLVEVMRGDEARRHLFQVRWDGLSDALGMAPDHLVALSTSQAVSLVLIALGLLGLSRR